MDFTELLKEIGLDLDSMDFDAIDGAQAALGDIICSRGEEAELGLSADPMGGGTPVKPDPRLNIPKKKTPSEGDSTIQNSNNDNSTGSSDSSDNDGKSGSGTDTSNDSDGQTDSDSTKTSSGDTETKETEDVDTKEGSGDTDTTFDDADSNDTDSDSFDDAEVEDTETDDKFEEEEEETEEDSELEDNEDLDDLDGVDDPDAVDPAKEERRRRIGRLRQVLSQAEDVITGNTKTESLHESAEDDLKEIQRLKKVLETAEDLSNEEFEAIEDEILKLTSRHVKLSVLSKEEKEKRLQRFKDEMNDQDVLDALEAEDNENRRKEHKQLSADEKRRQQIKGRPSLGGFTEFKNSLYKAVARQVSRGTQSERTWMRPDKHNTNPDIAKKGVRKNNLIKAIPSIDFYFDQSGSWDDKDINTGNKAVALLQDMERQKKLNINVYYFSNDLTTDPNDSCLRGGTHAWTKIVAKIKENDATNVVIMTDSDMEYQADNASGIVPGYVWYLWKNGERAQSLPKNLVGKNGTLEFKFTIGD